MSGSLTEFTYPKKISSPNLNWVLNDYQVMAGKIVSRISQGIALSK